MSKNTHPHKTAINRYTELLAKSEALVAVSIELRSQALSQLEIALSESTALPVGTKVRNISDGTLALVEIREVDGVKDNELVVTYAVRAFNKDKKPSAVRRRLTANNSKGWIVEETGNPVF